MAHDSHPVLRSAILARDGSTGERSGYGRLFRLHNPMLAQTVIAMTAMADTSPISTTTLTEKASLLLGFDLHWWEQAMIWSLGTAAIAAVAVVVSTASVVLLQRDEAARAKRELEAYKLLVEARVADAKTEGIRAGEKAGNALIRAAELEKEAANARQETERIKGVVAWRAIPGANAVELERILAAKPGAVNLRWTAGDPEALFLAIQLSQLLSKAGWSVAPGALQPMNRIVFGIILPDGAGSDAQTLREAFSAAHISFAIGRVPPGSSLSIQEIPDAPELMIGSRPPPQIP